MDLWTSRATHPYLSCTVHFIDCSWELQPLYRETVPLFKEHTGGNITESLLDMNNRNLSPDQVIVTTAGNGVNFVAGLVEPALAALVTI